MSEIRFFLDNIEVSNPKDWAESELVWEFDEDTRFFAKKYEGDVTFHGDGYTYIEQQFTDNGLCDTIDVRIEYKCDGGEFNTIHNGRIFLSDCSFNLQKCTVSCSISDNSFHAMIKNSQKMKFFLNAGFTKDGSAITVVDQDLHFHNMTTGIYDVNDRLAYRVEDAFRFLIGCMTNNEVGFTSDFFSVTENSPMLITGEEIRLHDGNTSPEVSFKDLSEELNKIYHIAFAVETSSGSPVVRCENFDYFFQDVEQRNLLNVPNVIRSVEEDKLYSVIKFGSSNDLDFDDSTPNTSFPKIRFVGWRQEEYNTVDECNIDNELDLENTEYVIDSNNIENQINGNEDADEEVFIVAAYEAGGDYFTRKDDFLSTGTLFFNKKYNNKTKAYNWLGAIPSSIAKYLGDGNDTFWASLGVAESRTNQSTGFTLPVTIFNNEIADPNNNYAPATAQYTAPADGVYVFETVYLVTITPIGVLFPITISTNWRVDPTGAPPDAVQDTDATLWTFPAVGPRVITHTNSLFLSSGDIVTAECVFTFTAINPITLQPQPIDITIDAASSFRCINAETGGGVYQTYEIDEAKVLKYDFEYPITKDEFEEMISDPDNYRRFVNINVGEGWVKRLSYPLVGGRATFQLITAESDIAQKDLDVPS